jgi:ubiquinone/menaquinone biosynthesis C-methylase UbiE
MRICKLLSLSICATGFLVAQDTVKLKPFGPVTLPGTGALYQQLLSSNIEGIGKFYMGRQISHVMGHSGATWLERPERQQEENTTQMIECLNLRPGNQVADIGVGTGYIARRMAKKIGPQGVVLGVDIEPKMLDDLENNMKAAAITNVKGHLGTIRDPKLDANSTDFIIMVDVYHEFSHPYEMMSGIVKALKPVTIHIVKEGDTLETIGKDYNKLYRRIKMLNDHIKPEEWETLKPGTEILIPGGRVAFVEYNGADPKVPIKRLHKMTEEQVLKEASLFLLKHVETYGPPTEDSKGKRLLPWQNVIFFEKTEVKKE